MKAMIFAAGLGTRLKEYTADRPKALVKVKGKTLLQHCIEHLKGFGVNTIVINIHHFADKVLKELSKHNNFGCEIIISDEREQLLETGGGLMKAARHLRGNEPLLVFNVDVLSNVDLNKMLEYHMNKAALATLATRRRVSSRYLLFDSGQQLCGWTNTKTEEVKMSRTGRETQQFAFSGIQILSPEIFDLIEEKGKFSITDSYLNLAREHKIIAYPHDEDYWFDVGSPQKLQAVEHFLKN